MQSQWQALLNNLPHAPEYRPVSPDLGYIACLTAFEYLRISGPDRLTFLQGQMSCDFNQIDNTLLLGANCNLKGRAIATFYAVDDGTQTFLVMPMGQAAPLKATLDKYALFSDASLHLPCDDYALVGLIGPATTLAHSTPLNPDQTIATDHGILARVRDTALHLCVSTPTSIKQWLSNDQGVLIADQCTWDQQQFLAGISHVTPDSEALFIPQELNYDLIGGISFNKGCYKGQEIIARLHYRGTYKQRTYRYTCDSQQAPTPGTPLYGSDTGQPCGQVVQAVQIAPGAVELMAVTKIKAQESEQVHLEQKDGPILRSLSLPYAITNTEGTD